MELGVITITLVFSKIRALTPTMTPLRIKVVIGVLKRICNVGYIEFIKIRYNFHYVL